MNRAVKEIYDDFDRFAFGHTIMYLFDKEPKFYNKMKEFDNSINDLPDPRSLVKYTIKKYWLFREITLSQMKEPKDPYDTVSFRKFTGQFAYSEQKSGYVPIEKEIEGTRKMKKIFKQTKPKRIRSCWEKAKKFLDDGNGEDPVLSYDFREKNNS